MNKREGHVGRKKSPKRIKNVTLLLGTSEYIEKISSSTKECQKSITDS